MPLFSPTRRMLSRPTSVFVQPQKIPDSAVTVCPPDSAVAAAAAAAAASPDRDVESSSLSSMSASQDECCSRPHTPSSSQADLVHSPNCLYSKRPTLADILADRSASPWTLSAFTAYCSQNLCLENLEFTIDARRYETMYNEVMAVQSHVPTPTQEKELSEKWRRILSIYIIPSGPREINIPGSVREDILRVPEEAYPPPPQYLQPALRKIKELLEDSILLPFLNDVKPVEDYSSSISHHNDSHHRANTISAPSTAYDSNYSAYLPRKHASAPGQPFAQRPVTHLPALNNNHSSGGSASARSDLALTSEASETSPSRGLGPATPPHSPPAVTFTDRMTSPRGRQESGGGWKKMSEKLGLRKSSHSKLKTSRSNSGNSS